MVAICCRYGRQSRVEIMRTELPEVLAFYETILDLLAEETPSPSQALEE